MEFKLSPDYVAAKLADPLLAAPDTANAAQRLLYHTINLPANVARLADASIAGIRGGKPYFDPIAPEAALPTPETKTQAVVDFAGALAPSIAGASLIGGGVGAIPGFARLASASPVAATAVKDAAILGGLGASEGAATGLEQAGEGAAYGALTGLPRLARIPVAAAIALGSKAFFDAHNPEAVVGGMSRGTLNAIIGGTLALAPGRKPFRVLPDFFMPGGKPPGIIDRSREWAQGHLDEIANDGQPVPGIQARHGSPYYAPGGWAGPVRPDSFPPPAPETYHTQGMPPNPGLAPGGIEPNIPFLRPMEVPFRQYAGLLRAPLSIPELGPRLPDDILERAVPAFDETIHAGGPSQFSNADLYSSEGMAATEKVKAFNDLQQAIARGKLSEIEIQMNNPVIKKHLEEKGLVLQAIEFLKRARNKRLETAQQIQNAKALMNQHADPLLNSDAVNVTPPKGKLAPLPEYKRTQGGGTFMDVLAPAARGVGGAAIGAAIDPDNPGEGAMFGLAAGLSPELIKLFFRAAEAAPFRNKNIVGAIGNTGRGLPKIVGPAITNADGSLISKGVIGDTHAVLKGNAIREGNVDAMDAAHAFHDSEGRVLSREVAAKAALDAKQITPEIYERAMQRSKDRGLHSEDLIEAQKLRPLQDMKLASERPSEAAFVMPEAYRLGARAVLGAVVGGPAGAMLGPSDMDPNLKFLGGAAVGALAFSVGPTIARKMQEVLANTKVATVANPTKAAARSFAEVSGSGLMPNSSATARFSRWIDKSFEVTLPATVKAALNTSKGMASWLLTQTDAALMKLSWKFKAPQALKDATNEFLDMEAGMTPASFLQKIAHDFPDDEQAMNYANLAVAGRETITGLQTMLKEGATPEQAAIIDASLGKYLTRSYKLFTHKNWEPDAEVVDRLAMKILNSGSWPGSTFESIRTELGQVIREAKQNAGLYKQPLSSSPIGKMIAQKSFIPRKQLSATYREFLGEVEDPTERVYQTIMRLRPMAEAGNYFHQLLNGVKEDGWLPHFFKTRTDKKAFEDALLARAANSTEDAERLAKYKQAWAGHQTIQAHPRMGILDGGVATRNVWDTLQSFDNVGNENAHPMMKSLMGIHTAIKLGRTVASPIQHIRQWVTMPMMMAISRAEPGDVIEAGRVLFNDSHALRREIMEMGIGNVDQVKGEFYNELKSVVGDKFNFGKFGPVDFDLLERGARRAGRNVMEAFRIPDNLVRIGTYISAKRRIAEQMGLSMSDEAVKTAATAFTNRYTMNYDAIVPFAKGLRNKPFANLFISYLTEMTRISKNLVTDAVMGGAKDGTTHSRMYAMFPLALIGAVPEIIQSGAEADLPEKDRTDWEQAKKLMPDYMRHRFYANIKRDESGNFTYQDFTPLIVSDALNQTVRALASGDLQGAATNNPVVGIDNTPVFNILTNQVMGMDRRTQREFRGKAFTPTNIADRLANIAKEVLPPNTPGIGSEAQRFVQAYSTNDKGDQGVTNTRTGVRLTPSDFWQPYWTGIKGGSVNLNIQQKRAVGKAKNEIANETAYMNDILRSDLNRDDKVTQTQRSLEAISEIQEGLRQVIQPQ